MARIFFQRASSGFRTVQGEFIEDVRKRKMTLATGSGTVHGSKYNVKTWGLDDLPA